MNPFRTPVYVVYSSKSGHIRQTGYPCTGAKDNIQRYENLRYLCTEKQNERVLRKIWHTDT
jgi:hypothetical protein